MNSIAANLVLASIVLAELTRVLRYLAASGSGEANKRKVEDNFFNSRVIKDIDEFKAISDVIVANHLSENLLDVKDKVYTRDIFNSDS